MHSALACRGEVGIAGMPPEEGGPATRTRTTAPPTAIVGVDDVQFWDFPDSQIRNTPELQCQDRRDDHGVASPMW